MGELAAKMDRQGCVAAAFWGLNIQLVCACTSDGPVEATTRRPAHISSVNSGKAAPNLILQPVETFIVGNQRIAAPSPAPGIEVRPTALPAGRY